MEKQPKIFILKIQNVQARAMQPDMYLNSSFNLQIEQSFSSKFIEFNLQEKKEYDEQANFQCKNKKHQVMTFKEEKETNIIFKLYLKEKTTKRKKSQISIHSSSLLSKFKQQNGENQELLDEAQQQNYKYGHRKEQKVHFNLENQTQKIEENLTSLGINTKKIIILSFQSSQLIVKLQCYLKLCQSQQQIEKMLSTYNNSKSQIQNVSQLNSILLSEKGNSNFSNIFFSSKKIQIKINQEIKVQKNQTNEDDSQISILLKEQIQPKNNQIQRKIQQNLIQEFTNYGPCSQKLIQIKRQKGKNELNIFSSQHFLKVQPKKLKSSLSKISFKSQHSCRSQSSSFIGSVHQAPQFVKFPNLTEGYRINFDSSKDIFSSLFMIHNQTVNIWSHLVGAFVVVILLISFISYEYEHIFGNKIKQKDSLSQEIYYRNNHLILKDPSQFMLKRMKSNKICEQFVRKCLFQKPKKQFLFQCQIKSKKLLQLGQFFQPQVNQILKSHETINAKFYCSQEKEKVKNNQNSSSNFYNILKNQLQILKHQTDKKELDFLELGYQIIYNKSHVSRWPVIFYLFCCFVALVCSAGFHLFFPMSQKAYKVSLSLDYAGINFLAIGSMTPLLYYGMYCSFTIAQFYIMICSILSIVMFTLSLTQWFNKIQNFNLKANSYIAFCTFNLIPMAHLVINNLFIQTQDNFSLKNTIKWYIVGGMAYFVGSLVYLFQCPQKNSPKKYDLCGHSHQIWHLFVLLGMTFAYIGVIACFQQRKQNVCQI